MTKRFTLTTSETGELVCPELQGYKLPELPDVRVVDNEAEILAELFHKAYERLAPKFCYETRSDTKEFDPTSPNGMLMIATITEVLKARERYEFTRQDMIDFACAVFNENYTTSDMSFRNRAEIMALQFKNTPRQPVAIEVEMEYTCCKRYINCKGCDATEEMIQPITPSTHPDGTVKATYIFND